MMVENGGDYGEELGEGGVAPGLRGCQMMRGCQIHYLSTGALLEPETPKNTGSQDMLGLPDDDEGADKTQEGDGLEHPPQVVLKPSCAGRAGPAPLPAAGAGGDNGDNALSARR